jgi:nicotinamide-nucleotide amidase
MHAELITIGDELLFGQTIDTNAAFIGDKLAEAGIDLMYHTTVGDQSEILLNAIGLALNRVDIVLATGGLGPTHDDITKKVICKFFRRQLVFHEEILKELEKRYANMGVPMPAINQNQALLPQGAKFIENRIGTALGLIFEERNKILIAMPGVPTEMKYMITEHVVPMLKQRGAAQAIVHRKIRTVGVSESSLFEKIKELIDEKSAIKIAFLPSYKGVDLRLTIKSDNSDKANQTLAELEAKIIERIGKYVFGYNNDELPEVIGKMLLGRGATLAVAESCTGGLVGKLLTDIPGSSAYFMGGAIVYSNELKTKLLGVPSVTIEQHGAVSAETARYMAEGIKNISGATLGLSLTGIAGPDGGTPEKPVGLTYIGLATPVTTNAREFRYTSDRDGNRVRAASTALDMVRRYLAGID